MIASSRYIFWWQRIAGLAAMTLLVAALFALADALVGGLGGNKGLIELIPGERFAISGPMPPKTEEIGEFVIEGEPPDRSVRLLPQAIFSGFWLGGSMWRGVIEIDATAREGRHVVRVKDQFGEKQNPALVFTVQVWPDRAARNANSPSVLTRYTGRSPFVFVLLFAMCGLAAGGANFLFGHLWARQLAVHGCGEIFKLRHTDRGLEASCEFPAHATVAPDMACTLFRPTGEALGQARVASLLDTEVVLLIERQGIVRLGDVACLAPSSSQGK